jgi:hypothetical protein
MNEWQRTPKANVKEEPDRMRATKRHFRAADLTANPVDSCSRKRRRTTKMYVVHHNAAGTAWLDACRNLPGVSLRESVAEHTI